MSLRSVTRTGGEAVEQSTVFDQTRHRICQR
jgi:hypothetical protein